MDKKSLLIKYLKKEATTEEQELLFDLLKNDSADEYDDILKQAWEELDDTSGIQLHNSSSLLRNIKEKAMGAHHLYSVERKTSSRSTAYKLAAAFAGFLLISSILLFTKRELHQTVHTNYGETETITLPDQSVVTLNANSTLRYSNKWDNKLNDRPREVWVEGEAFFHVTHQANHQKFIVHTKGLNIEVLGTEFNVNNRRGKTEVMLNSGKVQLSQEKAENDVVVMKPGELAVYSETNKEIDVKIVNPEVYTSWTNDQLIFDDTSLTSIAEMLEDNYGYKVVMKNIDLTNKQFSGSVPVENIPLLLKKLSLLYNLKITNNSNVITIENKP